MSIENRTKHAWGPMNPNMNRLGMGMRMRGPLPPGSPGNFMRGPGGGMGMGMMPAPQGPPRSLGQQIINQTQQQQQAQQPTQPQAPMKQAAIMNSVLLHRQHKEIEELKTAGKLDALRRIGTEIVESGGARAFRRGGTAKVVDAVSKPVTTALSTSVRPAAATAGKSALPWNKMLGIGGGGVLGSSALYGVNRMGYNSGYGAGFNEGGETGWLNGQEAGAQAAREAYDNAGLLQRLLGVISPQTADFGNVKPFGYNPQVAEALRAMNKAMRSQRQ